MPTVLLIGIPIVVAVLLWAILSLPDEEEKTDEEVEAMEPEVAKKPKAKKSVTTKKKTR